MRRLIRRSRANDFVKEDIRSYLINSANLFIYRKYNKRCVKKYVKTRKSLSI